MSDKAGDSQMIVNPKTLSWAAPETNVDGSPIKYDLEYEVGLRSDGQGDYEPLVTIPGQLQSDGRYEAPIKDLALEHGEHRIALRSFAKDEPERVSEWSEPVLFALKPVPSAPLELRVT